MADFADSLTIRWRGVSSNLISIAALGYVVIPPVIYMLANHWRFPKDVLAVLSLAQATGEFGSDYHDVHPPTDVKVAAPFFR